MAVAVDPMTGFPSGKTSIAPMQSSLETSCRLMCWSWRDDLLWRRLLVSASVKAGTQEDTRSRRRAFGRNHVFLGRMLTSIAGKLAKCVLVREEFNFEQDCGIGPPVLFFAPRIVCFQFYEEFFKLSSFTADVCWIVRMDELAGPVQHNNRCARYVLIAVHP